MLLLDHLPGQQLVEVVRGTAAAGLWLEPRKLGLTAETSRITARISPNMATTNPRDRVGNAHQEARRQSLQE